MDFDDITWKNIILEADDDLGDDELSATDYAESEDMDIEGSEPDDAGGEESDPLDEDPLDEGGEGEENTDDESDPLDEDPLDEGGEGGDDPLNDDPLAEGEGEGTDDDTSEDEQTDNEENTVSDKQNINLINDFIELYKRIDIIMNQIRTDCKTGVRYNPNILVVRENLTKLKEITYDYITNKFNKESYVSNLYQFNLIIQALNVNIELFDSIVTTTRNIKNKEKDKRKKTNKK